MDMISSSTQIHRFFSTPNKPITLTTQTNHIQFHFQTFVVKYDAHQVFDEMPKSSDTLVWNKIIKSHVQNGDFNKAVSVYTKMLAQGVRPNRHTLPRILAASHLVKSLSFGKQLHGHVLKFGLCSDDYVVSALIELYGGLDGAEAAKWVFDKSPHGKSLVSWTLLGGFYVREGKPKLANELFNEMVEFGCEMDRVALATAIGVCGELKSLQEGRNAHKVARKCGLEFDVLVSNSLLKMYVDCGSVKDAREVFDKMPERDAISWTGMVGGYVKKGEFNEGLKLFRQMIVEGIKPDSSAISTILPACARMAAHKNGKEIHGYLLRNGIDMNLIVHNALMDMYVKSGFIEYASEIFSRIKSKDIISWTVMILGYSLHGRGDLGVDLFREMARNPSSKIDEITYVTVLYACCSAIMVEEGKYYFDCINSPKVAHCALMVTLLARAGLFDEARSFIEERKIEQHAEIQRALLDGYRVHQNVNSGKRVIERLCDLEPLNADNYVMLSNWYAHNAKWDIVEELRETINDMGLRPKKAYSWIEYRNKVHVFGTGDLSHPRSQGIYRELESLMKKVEEEEGIMLSSDFSLHDVDEERESIPIGHSELLAISFGLISTQAESTIRVTKNLRVCRNCHDFVKVLSKVVGREIIIRDPSCFHHFKDGSCSCQFF